MSSNATQTGKTIPLPSVLNLGVAESLREQFVEHSTQQTNLIIDASEVETITTPCIQVLLAASHAMDETGGRFSVTAASESFETAFQDLGLNVIFNKWSS